MVIKAVNTPGASLGDHVAVEFKPGAIGRSLALLVGIPGCGLLLGSLIGLIFRQRFEAAPVTIYLFALTGLLAGIGFSVAAYRRISAGFQPSISHIVASGTAAAEPAGSIDPVCRKKLNGRRAVARLEYRGRTFHFCRPDCLEAFVKGPQKYVPP
jgi:YHS domain-containing protein